MEKLKFSDYIILCSEFEEDPENIEKLEEIEEFISKLEIREFIPFRDKELIAMDIINSIHSDIDAPSAAVFLEINRTVKGLLSYCINLINDLPLISYDYFVSDFIYEYGLYDAIIVHCEKDFERLLRLVDDIVNATNIYRITQTASLFNEQSYKDWINSMQELKKTVNSDSIKSLLSIIGSESEEGKDLLTKIGEMVMEQTNKEMDLEAKKFEKAAEFQESSASEDEENSDDEVEEGESTNVN